MDKKCNEGIQNTKCNKMIYSNSGLPSFETQNNPLLRNKGNKKDDLE
jgi:hypothetical protein